MTKREAAEDELVLLRESADRGATGVRVCECPESLWACVDVQPMAEAEEGEVVGMTVCKRHGCVITTFFKPTEQTLLNAREWYEANIANSAFGV